MKSRIDSAFVGALRRRLVLYWCVTIVAVFLTTTVITFLYAGLDRRYDSVSDVVAGVVSHHWPIFVCFVLVVPLSIRDILRLTTRFARPMDSLCSSLHQLAAGGIGPKTHDRLCLNDDAPELADTVRRVARRLRNSVARSRKRPNCSNAERVDCGIAVPVVEAHPQPPV